jgi:uncharacterized protein YbjT (DUF2867 family)
MLHARVLIGCCDEIRMNIVRCTLQRMDEFRRRWRFVMSILVTGATGNVGTRLVRSLVASGQRVRAFVRSGEKAKFDPSVEVVTGDFMDKASLKRAVQGVSKMYLLSAASDLEEHDANAIDAAKEAGLELVVKHSVVGAAQKASIIPRWHRAGEERLEKSGIPWVFLRPSSFTSNTLGWVGSVKSAGTVYNPLGNASLPIVHPDDIADVAAAVLTKPGHAGKAYDVTGPESLTTEQQAEILGQVIGKPLKVVALSDEAMKESMLKAGTPAVYVDARVGLVQLLRGIGRIDPSPTVKSLTGQNRTFRQWAEANAAAFR